MAEFTLPANSRVQDGKTWAKPEGAKRTKNLKIYRWDPDVPGQKPYLATYAVNLKE